VRKVNKQSYEMRMEALLTMQWPDRLLAVVDGLRGPQKAPVFVKLTYQLIREIASYRAPGICPVCGILQPYPSHLCRYDGDHADFPKWPSEAYGSLDLAIARNDEMRRDVNSLTRRVAGLVRDTLEGSKVDKGYIRTAFDMLKLTAAHGCFDYMEAALMVCQRGNMIDDLGEDEWKQYNRNTLTILKWCPYDVYLNTDHWQRVRKAALEQAGGRCQTCNTSGNETTLQAHHRTYENRGQEQPGDLTVLCRDCHEAFHKNGKVQS